MKKKILALCLVVVLAITAVTGATLAYFTDADKDTNVFVSGNVDIEQYEHAFDADDKFVELSANDVSSALKLMPVINTESDAPYLAADEKFMVGTYYENLDISDGKTALADRYAMMWDEANVVDKFVSVTNTGNNDVYVRTIVAWPAAIDAYLETCAAVPGITWDYEDVTTDPVNIGGIDYYWTVFTYVRDDGILEPGKSTGPSLMQVLMKSNTKNEDIPAAFKNGFNILVASQAVQADGFKETFAGQDNIPELALNEAFGEVTATNHPCA